MIKFIENKIDVEEYNYLYDAVGWGHYEKEIALEALKNNIFSVTVYDDEKVIGYGRIIGDKTIFLYIHDVMVIPEYQSKGIGTAIMKKLLERIEEIKKVNPSMRVYLGASKNKEEFYKKFGFVTRKDAYLGEGMILRK